MANKLDWTTAQQQAISERDREVAVSAAAGSGKTAVLVQRVVQAALGSEGYDPVPLEQMLVVTFTKAAAAEMKTRLEGKLLDAREELRGSNPGGDGARADLLLLNRQLNALPLAQISTIDSFLADIIRRYGYINGVQLGKVLGEGEAKLVRHRIATEMLDEALDGSRTDVTELALAWGGRDGLGAEDLSQARSDKGLRNLVLKLSEFCQSLADPEKWFAENFEGHELGPDSFDPGHPLLQTLAQQLRDWVAETTQFDNETTARLEAHCPAAMCLDIIRLRKRILERVNLDGGWEACAATLELLKEKHTDLDGNPTPLSMSKKGVDDQGVEDWLRKRQGSVSDSAKDWIALFGTPWTDVAASENAVRAHTRVLWALVQQFDALYSTHKAQRNVCDFADLSRGAFTLLAVHDAGGKPVYGADGSLQASTVASEYRQRFALVVVDEFQDTNPLQEAIIGLVTRDAAVGDGHGRPVFIVGDLKQSIYSFRLAEPLLLERRRKRLAAANDGLALKLAKNFRSRKAVLAAINHIFLGLMDETLGGEDYAQNALEPGLDYSQLFKAANGGPEPDTKATLHLVRWRDGESTDPDDEVSKNQLQYRQVANVLREIREQGQRVYEKTASGGKTVRPVAWRDMVVLLRSGASGRLEDLRYVLESAGIPTYAPARSGFFERPEISDAIALMRILDNPRDDIALAAALTGPAGGLSPVQLLELTQTEIETGQAVSLWDKTCAFALADGGHPLRQQVAGFIGKYHHWRDCARHKPTPEMLWQLLQEAALPVAYSAARNGEQRVENLLRLHNLACEVAAPNQHGLAWFLRYLEQSKRAKGDLGEAPILGEGEDVVRVMTIHQSKGLEFPVVVVPDLGKKFNTMDLNTDLLWHRDLGFGGRHVDFQANPPRRTDTLSRRLTRQAKLRGILAEELRVLYVALTRARERLELVGIVDDNFIKQVASPKPKTKAINWLDWIAPKFAENIEAAWDTPDADCPDTPDSPWRLNITTAEAYSSQAGTRPDAPAIPTEVVEAIKTRLTHKYKQQALTNTGTKLSVTALAKHAGDDGQVVAYKSLDENGEPLVATVQPKFMAGSSKIGAAEIGSATHLVCAHLDYHQPPDATGLQSLCCRLVESGKLDAEVIPHLDIAAIANAATDISQRFVTGNSQVYPELAVGMQLSADDETVKAYYGTEEQGSSTDESSGFVFVQGAVDLLIVSGNEALVLDFKTDRNADAQLLLQRHSAQLELYSRCVSLMLPGAKVSWLVYGLAGAGAVGPFELSNPQAP